MEVKMPEESNEQSNTSNETTKPPDIKKILEKIDSEHEKRKAAEAELKEVAENLKNQVPEEYRDLVPNLPPGQLIKWLQDATSKGLFNPKSSESLDSKKPGGKSPINFENMNPVELIKMGLKKNRSNHK
jgi:hypothetical protein